MHEYDLIADWYVAGRKRGDIGIPELTTLIAALPRGAAVLDIGCGDGIPLTATLVDAGCDVFAIDSSEEMVARFRQNFPTVPVTCAAIQAYDFEARTFDAVHAWGVIFHLTPEAQGAAFAKVAALLKPGGLFLFTSGDVDGSIEGQMNGVTFRYFSFDEAGYRNLLLGHGLKIIDVHTDRGGNTYYLAERRELS
jgi:SAM-dependent methyltransferase